MKRLKHPSITFGYERELEMLRSGADLVPPPILPDGYVLRQVRSNEKQAYEELFHLAWEEDFPFEWTLGDALPGGFFVLEHLDSGHLVASCVAGRGSLAKRHHNAGSLGWLVTDPAHTRMGLGTAVAAAATNRLVAAGYARPFLTTEDPRVTAIAIYLGLGWQPYVFDREMEDR
jgi:mycothiol synthase